MKAFGVRSAYGALHRVIMHRPGVELDLVTPHSLREFNFDRPVDREAFVRDYDAMVELFHRDGVSPHLRGRWGDQRLMGRAFEKLGVPLLGAIEPPGYLEGGGVTMIGEDTVVASICDRANQEGTAALRSLVLGQDAKYFLEVPLPFGYIHIDGIFMMLDEALCLIFEEAFRTFPCWLYEAGRAEPRHVMFEEFLDERGAERLPISDDERLGGHLNVVITKRGARAIGLAQAGVELLVAHRFPEQRDLEAVDFHHARRHGRRQAALRLLADLKPAHRADALHPLGDVRAMRVEMRAPLRRRRRGSRPTSRH